MLVLSRKAQEWILIDGEIMVHVLSTGGGRVRLGIEAPDNVRIVRGELAREDGFTLDSRSGFAQPTLETATPSSSRS